MRYYNAAVPSRVYMYGGDEDVDAKAKVEAASASFHNDAHSRGHIYVKCTSDKSRGTTRSARRQAGRGERMGDGGRCTRRRRGR